MHEVNQFISIEKRYEHITKMLEYCNEKIIQSFNLFIKLFSLVIGGYFWLYIQDKEVNLLGKINSYFPLLLGTISAICIIQIWGYWQSWYGYRKAESKLVGVKDLPLPKLPKALLLELVMTIVIILSVVLAIFGLKIS